MLPITKKTTMPNDPNNISTVTYRGIVYKVGDILKNKFEEYVEILKIIKPYRTDYKTFKYSVEYKFINRNKVNTSFHLFTDYFVHATEKEIAELTIKDIIE